MSYALETAVRTSEQQNFREVCRLPVRLKIRSSYHAAVMYDNELNGHQCFRFRSVGARCLDRVKTKRCRTLSQQEKISASVGHHSQPRCVVVELDLWNSTSSNGKSGTPLHEPDQYKVELCCTNRCGTVCKASDNRVWLPLRPFPAIHHRVLPVMCCNSKRKYRCGPLPLGYRVHWIHQRDRAAWAWQLIVVRIVSVNKDYISKVKGVVECTKRPRQRINLRVHYSVLTSQGVNLLKRVCSFIFCHADRSPLFRYFVLTVALLDAAVSSGIAGLRLIPHKENICRVTSYAVAGDAATFTTTGFGHGLIGLSVGDDLPADHRPGRKVWRYLRESMAGWWFWGGGQCRNWNYTMNGASNSATRPFKYLAHQQIWNSTTIPQFARQACFYAIVTRPVAMSDERCGTGGK